MPFRPDRLRRLWRAAGAFGRRDPTIFIAMFALWMALQGVSLLAPGNVFDLAPSYSLARDLGLNEDLVGVAMLVNAAALAWSLGDRPPHVRAWLAFMSGALWIFWALLMLFSGFRAGLLSGAGVWTIAAAVVLIRAAPPFAADGAPAPERAPLPRSPQHWDDTPTLCGG